MTGEERSSERMMEEEEGEVVNDPERQRDGGREGERERGHRRSGNWREID